MTWLERWHPVDRSVVALSGVGTRSGLRFALGNRFLASAVRERTAGVIAGKISDSRFERIADSVLARNVLALSQAGEILRRIGPEVIPLKGLYLIDRMYPVGERDLGDLDLLVRKAKVPEVVAGLEDFGFRSSVPVGKVMGGGGTYLNSVSLSRPGSFPVHLHWHVVNASLPLFMVRIPVEELWRESVPAIVAGVPVRALASHHLLVTICEHALKHSYEALIHLLDIDRVVRSGVDVPEAIACAHRWGVETPVLLGLFLCRKMLGTPVDVGMPGGAPARWIVGSLRNNRRWPGIGSLGYFSMAKGVGEKARFLAGTFFPPGKEVESFGKRAGLLRVVHRGWRAILGGRGAI